MMKSKLGTFANSSNTSSSSAGNLPSRVEGIVFCSAFALEAVLIVIGNLFTIVLFAANKKLRIRRKGLFLIMNMSFADLMLGAVDMPFYIFYAGDYYQLWTGQLNLSTFITYTLVENTFSQASLISAALISVERFYAIYFPYNYKALSVRIYHIVICVIWSLALIFAMIVTVSAFISDEHQTTFYASVSYSTALLLTLCVCNIASFIKLQQGSFDSQLQNRALRHDHRLTKILLFVSIIALVSWLPVLILNLLRFGVKVSYRAFYVAYIFFYSNAFCNPVVYVLLIPEFRQGLVFHCFRRRWPVSMEGSERGDNRAATLTPVTRLRTLPTDPSLSNTLNVPDFKSS